MGADGRVSRNASHSSPSKGGRMQRNQTTRGTRPTSPGLRRRTGNDQRKPKRTAWRRSKVDGGRGLALLCLTIPLLPFTNGCAPGGTATQFVGDLPAFEIEEDLRIDGHTADLVPVFWLGVGPDGTIAAIQRLLSGVRFFDSVGNDLGLVGREGEGPEEFRVPARQVGWAIRSG